jgi:hypothetical protein
MCASEGEVMHLHSNQFDPNLMQMYAMHAAAKTEAKREAECTRRKLMEGAWALGCEYDDDCVVQLSGDGGSEGHAGGQNRDGQSQDRQAGSGSGEDMFSDWA